MYYRGGIGFEAGAVGCGAERHYQCASGCYFPVGCMHVEYIAQRAVESREHIAVSCAILSNFGAAYHRKWRLGPGAFRSVGNRMTYRIVGISKNVSVTLPP